MQITESPNISNVTEQHLAIKDAILPYLEVKGLISLSQTCKTARGFFLDTVLFDYINSSHTSLQLFKFDPICLKNILRKSGAQLSCLKLTRVTTQVASRLISECPNLIHLEIESLKDKETNWFCSLVETGILKAEKL